MLKFKGKGLFVFSDPGGAKAVLAHVCAIKRELGEFKIISDKQYSFYKDFGLPIVQQTHLPTPKDVVEQMRPDFIFTGTSYTSSIELQYLKAAKQNSITSYSFIDHWTFFKKRFLYSEEYIFPDFILVLDEKAKKQASDEGIDGSTIEIFNNPYYLYIEKWKPDISKAELLDKLGVKKKENKLVVFAPDPLSNVNGMQHYGFDEISVTKTISKMLESKKKDYIDQIGVFLTQKPNQFASLGNGQPNKDDGKTSSQIISLQPKRLGMNNNLIDRAA